MALSAMLQASMPSCGDAEYRDARSAERPVFEFGAIWVNPSRSNLLAKVTVMNHRWGQTLVDCSIVRTRIGGAFVLPPSAPLIGRDGVVRKDDGKPQYKPLIEWTKEAGRRVPEAIVKLVEARHPNCCEARHERP
jgi:hypothetical protein